MAVSEWGHRGAGLPNQAVEAFCDALCHYNEALAETGEVFGIAAGEEEQLKAPTRELVKAAGRALGYKGVVAKMETPVFAVRGRPDIGIAVDKLAVGYLELKAPTKSGDPTKLRGKHDERQWQRFQALPNLIYTNSRTWTLWTFGKRRQHVDLWWRPGHVDPDCITNEDAARLLGLLADFFLWEPAIPTSTSTLAANLAPLCRLLRSEVADDIRNGGPMGRLLDEWRSVLFPGVDEDQFADSYAQTFVYALLLARMEGLHPVTASSAADTLDSDHALLAQVLRVLGQRKARVAVDLSVTLLERLLTSVVPENLGDDDICLYFYQEFLASYDPQLQRKRGVYFTPAQIVNAQVRWTNQIVMDHLGRNLGLADPDVVTLSLFHLDF